MKEIFIILVLTLLFTSSGFSQVNNSNENHSLKGDIDYVNLSFGRIIPIGDFGSKDMNSKNSGFAKPGYKMELNAGYHIIPNLYGNAIGFYSSYNSDASGLTNLFLRQNTDATWKSTGGDWKIAGGMVGLAYDYPFSEKFTMETKLLVGLMSTQTSALTITASDGSKYTDGEKSALASAYMVSVGGNYPVGNLFNLAGNIEYISSNPKFDNVITTITTGNAISSVTSTIQQHINLLSFNLGVLVVF